MNAAGLNSATSARELGKLTRQREAQAGKSKEFLRPEAEE